eukprot:3199474-Pleurochrysis_carterae.AAC.1
MRQESFQGKAKSGRYSHHVSLYPTVECMRGEPSQSEREVGGHHEETPKVRKAKNLAEAPQKPESQKGAEKTFLAGESKS